MANPQVMQQMMANNPMLQQLSQNNPQGSALLPRSTLRQPNRSGTNAEQSSADATSDGGNGSGTSGRSVCDRCLAHDCFCSSRVQVVLVAQVVLVVLVVRQICRRSWRN